MTVLETYPIHRCIYRNDAVSLRELLMDKKVKERINENDNHGNSPLHLALMLNRFSCISILLQNGSDIFCRNSFGWSALNESSLLGNADLIETMTFYKWKNVIEKITGPGGLMEEWNKTTPNLYVKYKGKIRTTIPLLQKLGYKDIEQFYKKGNSVRLDFTIGGFDMSGIPKVIRGNMSFILKFDESSGIYKVFIIDHNEKKYQEFYPNIPRWYLDNSIRSKLSASKLYKFKLDLSQFTFKEKKGGLLKKSTKTFQLENGKSYKCTQYKAKKANIFIKKRNDEAKIGESESIIKTKYIKGDSNKNPFAKYIKNENNGSSSSTESIHRKNTEASNSDDDSDSDSSNSDNETNISDDENESTIKSLPLQDNKESNNIVESKKTDDDNTVTYTVNRNGETKTYEKKTELEDTLDWEQAYCDKYYQDNNAVVHNILNTNDDEKTKRLNHMDIVKLNLKKITEEEYFDSNSTLPLHMGRIMNVVEERKAYKHKIKLWMAKESSNFPIAAIDLKPVLELFMMLLFDQVKSQEDCSDMEKMAYKFITQDIIEKSQNKHSFPVKISVPLYQSIAFQLTTLDCSKDVNMLPDELFEIPKDYKNDNVFFKIINRQ
ncbi:hypothetical protein BCR36DRAFT_323355 [Piromyces finnis]|uniref:Ankyrin repeat domain-containing protein n=1 Tax=Piromyces finnis TaxID=1754191 RepID=A0A1Y1VEF8_9FUNG|nr:hypothetical protein BCR36DRAFT_323355 [Piromyces finnis]|eukprot:ORX53909.1 hypothetical protein BCR36DRAFT_323355 [Piromyces finnis]